jgi:hypothetical protein
MTRCENGKVGISIAYNTTAGEFAESYSIVSINSAVV